MRILFGANNFSGSNIMLSRFLENAKDHEVKIAAYYKNNEYLHHIDWCLDGLYNRKSKLNYFQDKYAIDGPKTDYQLTNSIINYLLEWQPDIIISDCEIFTASLSNILDIPLIYCSPLLQYTGLNNKPSMLNINNIFSLLPPADSYLIYSPLGDTINHHLIKDGFNWVRPYYKEPSKIVENDFDIDFYNKCIPQDMLLTTGETSFISDCFYNNKKFFISPNHNDYEQLLNANLFQKFGISKNIGRTDNYSFLKNKIAENYEINLNMELKNIKRLDEFL